MQRLLELADEVVEVQQTNSRHHLAPLTVIGMQQVRALERIAAAVERLATYEMVKVGDIPAPPWTLTSASPVGMCQAVANQNTNIKGGR